MREVTYRLIRDFRQRKIDWMGYDISAPQDLTFHHIIKKTDGGLYVYNNGALLNGNTAHPYLHLIEAKDYDMYLYLNALLKNINTQGYQPSKNQLLAVRSILEQFEREHSSDITNKGKPLIKEKYLETRHFLNKL